MKIKNQKGIVSFQRIVTFFRKKGNSALIEKKVRLFLIDKNKLKKEKRIIIEQAKKSLSNVTPYLRLLMRKRGKRVIYRVGHLGRRRWKKKACLSIAKGIRESKKEYFLTGLQKEIAATVLKQGSLFVKRKEYHKTAKRFAPYFWKANFFNKRKARIKRKKFYLKFYRGSSKKLKNMSWKNLKKVSKEKLERLDKVLKKKGKSVLKKKLDKELEEKAMPVLKKTFEDTLKEAKYERKIKAWEKLGGFFSAVLKRKKKKIKQRKKILIRYKKIIKAKKTLKIKTMLKSFYKNNEEEIKKIKILKK